MPHQLQRNFGPKTMHKVGRQPQRRVLSEPHLLPLIQTSVLRQMSLDNQLNNRAVPYSEQIHPQLISEPLDNPPRLTTIMHLELVAHLVKLSLSHHQILLVLLHLDSSSSHNHRRVLSLVVVVQHQCLEVMQISQRLGRLEVSGRQV